MRSALLLMGCAGALVNSGRAAAAPPVEPSLTGGKVALRLTNDPRIFQLFTPGQGLQLQVSGPGQLSLILRPVQPALGALRAPEVLVAVDGADQLRVPLPKKRLGHFTNRRDLAPGPSLARSLRIGDGPHLVTLAVARGEAAAAVHFVALTAPGDLPSASGVAAAATGLAGAPPASAPAQFAGASEVPIAPPADAPRRTESPLVEPPLKLPPPSDEPEVPLTIDAPAENHKAWPIYTLVGALGFAFGGGVLWAVAAETDSGYNGTPSGPGRSAKLDTANTELHVALALGGVAAALLATTAIGLVF